jgi:hypothetical protein
MKRPFRILLNFATALSLIFCALALIFRVRGTWIEDYAYRAKPNGPAAIIVSSHGSVWIGVEDHWPREGHWQWSSESISATNTYNAAIATTTGFSQSSIPGISWIHARGWISRPPAGPIIATAGTPPSVLAISIDWWLLIIVGALLPLTRFARWREKKRQFNRRQLAGLCPACGYDLRATPGRCPECGRTPSQSTAQ